MGEIRVTETSRISRQPGVILLLSKRQGTHKSSSMQEYLEGFCLHWLP